VKLSGGVAAVVTGGASGLGEATARALAGRGVRVALFDIDEERGETLAAQIGGVLCKADVTNDAEMISAFAAARSVHGQERILVNCAGVGSACRTAARAKETGAIEGFPLETFERVIAVNLIGTFRAIVLAATGMLDAPRLHDGERGVIVNTASVAAEDGQIGQAAYAASKGGIAGMTLPIARDLAAEGIRVNTILPGIFRTPSLDALPREALEALGAAVPFPQRPGEPAEFADLVLTMITNAYFNAASVRLDGAIRMPPR
jgi:NAD(P)-dependent dehydrogenase (short-subunit alcohol dehydrogenase family)